MAVNAFTKRPIAARCATGIFVVGEHPHVIDVDATPVFADVVDGHAVWYLTVDVSPCSAVCRSAAMAVFFASPTDLCVAVC